MTFYANQSLCLEKLTYTQLPGSVVNDELIVSELPTDMFCNEFFLQPFFLTVATIMFLAKKQGPQSGCLARDRLPITIFLLHTFPPLIGLAGILKFGFDTFDSQKFLAT